MNTIARAMFSFFTVVLLLASGCLSGRGSGGSTRIQWPDELPPHPRFLLDQEEIDGIREEAKTDAWVAGIITQIVNSADAWDPAELSGLKPGLRHSAFTHNALDLALAYQFTDETEYARKAARILVAYADLAPTLERTGMAGLLTDSTMGEADRIVYVCWAYDLVYNASVLSDDEKLHIERDLIDRMGYVSGRGCNHWNSSNWRARALVVVASAGFTTGNRELIDEALNGWYKTEYEAFYYGFAQHVGHAIRSDGTYWETSFGYSMLSLYSMVYIAEIATHSDVDLWDTKIDRLEKLPARAWQRELSSPGESSLADALDGLLYRGFPNMQVTQTGNSRNPEVTDQWHIFGTGYRRTKDPRYAWLVRRTREKAQANSDDPQKRPANLWALALEPRDVPSGRFSLAEDRDIGLTGRHRNGSTLLPDGGFVIMRGGKGDDIDSTSFQMNYGRVENSHDHPDRLAVALYGLDRILAPDAGKLNYGADLQLTWMKQTLAHNTVTIGETSQYPQEDKDSIWVDEVLGKPARGDLVFFHSGKEFKAVRAVSDKVYDNVFLDRTTVLLDPFVIDVFSVSCNEETSIDWAWHGYGTATSSVPGEAHAGPLSPRKGYRHLTNATVRTSAQDWDVTWADGDIHMRLYQLGEPDTTHVVSPTPGIDARERTVAVSRRMGSNTVFVSVIEPYRDESRLVSLAARELGESLAIELVHADGTDTVLLPLAPGKQLLSLGDADADCFALWRRESPQGVVVGQDAAIMKQPAALELGIVE